MAKENLLVLFMLLAMACGVPKSAGKNTSQDVAKYLTEPNNLINNFENLADNWDLKKSPNQIFKAQIGEKEISGNLLNVFAQAYAQRPFKDIKDSIAKLRRLSLLLKNYLGAELYTEHIKNAPGPSALEVLLTNDLWLPAWAHYALDEPSGIDAAMVVDELSYAPGDKQRLVWIVNSYFSTANAGSSVKKSEQINKILFEIFKPDKEIFRILMNKQPIEVCSAFLDTWPDGFSIAKMESIAEFVFDRDPAVRDKILQAYKFANSPWEIVSLIAGFYNVGKDKEEGDIKAKAAAGVLGVAQMIELNLIPQAIDLIALKDLDPFNTGHKGNLFIKVLEQYVSDYAGGREKVQQENIGVRAFWNDQLLPLVNALKGRIPEDQRDQIWRDYLAERYFIGSRGGTSSIDMVQLLSETGPEDYEKWLGLRD